ncbi:MAG: winged helix-turn-helix domain-containing protein [Candidatus Thermoplasmatota archaeon]|jgi:hypothetical protein|nr:winged helix-turn-helix domain-containing protein [Candidatus Thermoplasmatota archaeon]
MPSLNEKFGRNAGKVWVALNTQGPLNGTSLIKKTKLSENDLYAAIGWLARENKIYKDGNFYKLGETNLTETIGFNAGKVWNTINSQKEIDVSSISKLTQIDIKDAYSALGWLAREDKIEATKPKTSKYKFKLK